MDLMPLKRFDIQLTDIWVSTQKQMIEMKTKIDVLSDCLKTSDLIISHSSKANETLIDVIDINVHKSPEFKPVIGIVRHLEETIQREKDNLRQMKTSLNDTNCGQEVEELIRRWKECVTARDQCIQTVGISLEVRNDLNENLLQNNALIAEEMSDDNSYDNQSMITTETTDWETCVDERSDVWSSDHSIDISLNPTAITIDDNNDCESDVWSDNSMDDSTQLDSTASDLDDNNDCVSEVPAKTATTDTDRSSSDERDRRQTLVRPAVKSLATNNSRVVRGHGLQELHSTPGRSPDGLYACDWPECTYSTSSQQYLILHRNAHNTVRPYACRWPGCQVRTSYPSGLNTHRLKHRVCSYSYRSVANDVNSGDNCQQMMTTETTAWETCVDERSGVWSSEHSIDVSHDSSVINIDSNNDSESQVLAESTTDTNRRGDDTNDRTRKTRVSPRLFTYDRTCAKPYACEWPDCTFATKWRNCINGHINVHKNLRPYACLRPGCEFRSADKTGLNTHRRRHNNDPDYQYRSQ